MMPVRLHSGNRVMMRVSLTTPAPRFVQPADAADQARLDLTLGIRAQLACVLSIDVNRQPKPSADV